MTPRSYQRIGKVQHRLRTATTALEAKLRLRMAEGPIADVTFQPQYVLGPYVLDFYCAGLKLAIEIGGEPEAEAQARSTARARFLKKKGIAALRLAEDAGEGDIEAVIALIRDRVLDRREELGFTLPRH
ncbi:MAG: DUF559 domain-containing protein [Alphaproteobacteria bacterium]|nr:DUF559 domain-containing protein [Alphaproteobacteria bacterium]